jgi:Ca2+-binding RTX toxin-like protein
MLGGSRADLLTADSGRDVLIGDDGLIVFDDEGFVLSAEGLEGSGADTIFGVSGNDLVIAGGGKDSVTVSGALTVVIGDSGKVSFEVPLQGTATILRRVEATPLATGDADILSSRGAKAVIIGGEGSDLITAPASETKAIILGDLGQARFDGSGILTAIQIAAYDSPDAYRVDSGWASSSLGL